MFAADVFQNNAGTPGMPLGSVSAPGTLDIKYFGRNFTTPTGTFNAEMTNFDFLGSFSGIPFEFKRNPSHTSTGVTTIVPLPGSEFQVSSFFDIFAELSIDNGPFIPGPERRTDLTGTIPEPATAGLAFLGLGAVFFVRRLSRERDGA